MLDWVTSLTLHQKKKKGYSFGLAYTIPDDVESDTKRGKLPDTLDFSTDDKELYSIWVDGLSHLLGKPLSSYSRDIIEKLTDLGVKVRLLDFTASELKIPNDDIEFPAKSDVLEHGFVFDERELYGSYEMDNEERKDENDLLVLNVAFD